MSITHDLDSDALISRLAGPGSCRGGCCTLSSELIENGLVRRNDVIELFDTLRESVPRARTCRRRSAIRCGGLRFSSPFRNAMNLRRVRGTKQTCRSVNRMSAFGGKADILDPGKRPMQTFTRLIVDRSSRACIGQAERTFQLLTR